METFYECWEKEDLIEKLKLMEKQNTLLYRSVMTRYIIL